MTARSKKRGSWKLTPRVRAAIVAARAADPRGSREDLVDAVLQTTGVRVSTGSVTSVLAAEKSKGRLPAKVASVAPQAPADAPDDDNEDVDLAELVNGQLRRLQRLVRTATKSGDQVEAARAARDAHDWARVKLRLQPAPDPETKPDMVRLAEDTWQRLHKMIDDTRKDDSGRPRCHACGQVVGGELAP